MNIWLNIALVIALIGFSLTVFNIDDSELSIGLFWTTIIVELILLEIYFISRFIIFIIDAYNGNPNPLDWIEVIGFILLFIDVSKIILRSKED